MILILTMAGRYQRFRNEGHKIPKYLLPWGDRTILSMIMSELEKSSAFSDVILVANHRDEAYIPHVHAIMRAHKINRENLIFTHDTKGQAETAMIAIQGIEKFAKTNDVSIVFHNID